MQQLATVNRRLHAQERDKGQETQDAECGVPRESGCRPADCGAAAMPPPPWVDYAKLKRAEEFFERHFLSVFVSNLVGLVCLLATPNILAVLCWTRRSHTVGAAFTRYLSTLNHIRLWYSGDLFRVDSRAHKSLQAVRRMHTAAFRGVQEAGVTQATQADMMVTQWAFFGLLLTHGPQLGLHCSRADKEALAHFWCCVGHLLGMEERHNLGAGEVEEVESRCRALVREVVVPALARPPHNFPPMVDALLHGVRKITPVVDPPAFLCVTHRLLGAPCDVSRLSWYSSFMLQVHVLVFEGWLHAPLLGPALRYLVNALLQLALYISNSFPAVPAAMSYLEARLKAPLQALGVFHDTDTTFLFRSPANSVHHSVASTTGAA